MIWLSVPLLAALLWLGLFAAALIFQRHTLRWPAHLRAG